MNRGWYIDMNIDKYKYKYKYKDKDIYIDSNWNICKFWDMKRLDIDMDMDMDMIWI